MFDKVKIISLCSSLNAAMDAKNWILAAKQAESLECAFRDQKEERLESVSDELTYFDMLKVAVRYLSFNNFYAKAWEHYEDASLLCDAIAADGDVSDEDKAKVKDAFEDLAGILGGTKKKHANLTIPRHDTRCCLCRKLPANKTGSHMVPNFLTAPTFSWDGVGKRGREAVDHCLLNDMEKFVSYYGPEVSPERIAQSLGHEMTDEEMEGNINQIEFDNVFCGDCEKRFGVLETYYAAYYNRQKKKIHPRMSYLFWLSVLWRMAIGRMGIFMDWEEEYSLRTIIDCNVADNEKEITDSNSDLGNWKYALFKAEGLKDGDKGILGSRMEHSPYVIMCNDLIVVFFYGEWSAEISQNLPIQISNSNVNDWKEAEKVQRIDRSTFWKVRDWIVDTSYDYYDPAREQAMLVIREQERSNGKSLNDEGKEICIKASRLSKGYQEKPLKLHKLHRVFIAYIRQREAAENGKEYDPLKDEELFLTKDDFLKYYRDLAAMSRAGTKIDISKMPFYKEARNAFADPGMWKVRKHSTDIDLDMVESVLWFNNLTDGQYLGGHDDLTTMPIVKGMKIGRNEPCPCGSGKKFKNCCGRDI